MKRTPQIDPERYGKCPKNRSGGQNETQPGSGDLIRNAVSLFWYVALRAASTLENRVFKIYLIISG